jgi:uncharacterized membrane protein
LQYLDWLRGIAVVAMVLAHVSDSWTIEADRRGEPWYAVAFIGGVASPLFLFLAGVATAMAAEVKGASLARSRGWQIFGLGLLFRVQSQILGFGPLQNLFKVDMLNIMGLAMVAATFVWQMAGTRGKRIAWFAIVTTAIAMITPIVRDVAWLAPLPDPLEAYLRPAGVYSAFPFFPWGGFLFAGVIVGELVTGVRTSRTVQIATGQAASRQTLLQSGVALASGAGVLLAWLASFQPSIYPSASFWHDSPTFFFIRLGLVTLLVPIAWVLEQLLPSRLFAPGVTLGRSSLFVYWVHIEMVYGVIAEPIKRSLPLSMSLTATALLCVGLYGLVILKNRLLARHGLPGPWRLLAPVIR